MNTILIFFLAILFSIFYTAIVEYAAHRWLMHKGIFGKNRIWRDHSIEHHVHRRTDINIELPPTHSFILGLPLLLLCFWLGWLWLLCVIVMAILHATTWTVLHSTYHGVGKFPWVKKMWYYKQWETHHLYHHDHPRKNYGAVFIYTDYLFGTKA
jgi:hypothetical protein